jgi:hypothetical protein
MMKNWLPIRKVAAGLVAAALVALARKNGISLGSADADQYANDFVGLIVAYVIPDPRVSKVMDKLSLRAKLRILNDIITAAQATPPAEAPPTPPAA